MQKSCPSTDRFLVREGSHKFDVSLVVRNASTTDAGEYVARVEVLNPGVSSRSYVRKNFRVSVRGKFPVDYGLVQHVEQLGLLDVAIEVESFAIRISHGHKINNSMCDDDRQCAYRCVCISCTYVYL